MILQAKLKLMALVGALTFGYGFAANAEQAVAQVAVTAAGKTAAQIRSEVISSDHKINVEKLLSNLTLLTKNKPEIAGKKVVVIFSATWCGPCMAFFPVAEKIQQENPNLSIIYVYGKGSDKTIVNHKVESSTLPITYDESEQVVFDAMIGAHGIPFALIIDPQGNVVASGYPQESKELGRVLWQGLNGSSNIPLMDFLK